MPKMKHPDSRRQITVADEQVPMYASQGWREVEATKARKRATKSTASTKGAAK